MPFRNDPILQALPRADHWALVRPLVYNSPGETIVIPAGFITDLASIPQLFRSIVPVNGRHRAPAILHDYLFVIQDRERAECDWLFLEAMEDAGVRWTQRHLIYRAVRLGGWLPWRNNARAIERAPAAHYRANGLDPAHYQTAV